MLNRVIIFSVEHRNWVFVAGLFLVLAGLYSWHHLPIDAVPDTTPVQVQINTVAPSLSPLETERQITALIEQSIGGLPGLVEVRSISKFTLSQVTAVFEDHTDIYRARQVVMERLQSVDIPPGIERPELGPVATGLGEVFHYIVRGSGKSLSELRTTQDWLIKPQLRSVSGVAEVNSWGGVERQVQVVVDPVRLQSLDLSLSELILALEQNNTNVGGGTLDKGGESSLIQGIGIVREPRDLEQIVVTARDGVPVRVGDVASVVEGGEIRRGATTAMGEGEVVLGLGFMLMGENSHDVTKRLGLRLEEIRKSLPPGTDVVLAYDRTELVDKVLHTVRKSLFEGAILVIAVLFAFLGNLRAGLIVAAAIPLSMLFAFNFMLQAGIVGSLMSLGAIDFGLIVDSSVIMVENATRRLSQNHDLRPVKDVVREAAIEVRRPTMFGELIILIVYLPILALEGVEGKLFRPMALTVIFALLGSLVLSLTLIPALCSRFLTRKPRERENRLVNALHRWYRPGLRLSLRRPWAVVSVATALVVCAGLLFVRLGSEFVPRLKEGAIVINTIRLAGVSLDESVRYGAQIERSLLAEFPDEIEMIWTRTGTAEVATDPMGVELSDVFMSLTDRSQWSKADSQEELVLKMEDLLSSMPGMRAVFTQPIEMRVNEMVAGVRADVAVKLFGDDFEVLKAKARDIENALRATEGAADVFTEQLTGQPVLEIEVDREAIARHGIPVRDVLDAVEMLGNRKVGTLQEGDRRFPIAIRLDDRYRADAASIGGILVSSVSGDRVPLDRLATIQKTEGPSTISREWGKRRIVVQTNVRGRDVGSFVAEIRDRIAENVELPPGYYVRFGGQFEHLERAQRRLSIVIPLALAMIFGLLFLTFRNIPDAIRVFSGVPLAVVGGILALFLRGLPFSISAAVGFIALSGVSVLNALVLVSSYRHLRTEGMDVEEALTQAADQRLRPVLMTALVASLGFVPMALNTGIGAEVQRPLATVVVGGVISSTLLTLLVLPALYKLTERRTALVGAGLTAREGTAAGPVKV